MILGNEEVSLRTAQAALRVLKWMKCARCVAALPMLTADETLPKLSAALALLERSTDMSVADYMHPTLQIAVARIVRTFRSGSTENPICLCLYHSISAVCLVLLMLLLCGSYEMFAVSLLDKVPLLMPVSGLVCFSSWFSTVPGYVALACRVVNSTGLCPAVLQSLWSLVVGPKRHTCDGNFRSVITATHQPCVPRALTGPSLQAATVCAQCISTAVGSRCRHLLEAVRYLPTA
jgi:hypothetical protein